MKHKLFTLFFVLMAGVGTMSAASVQIGDLYYTLYSTYEHSLNGESVTDYNCAVVARGNSTFTGEIVIPETVEYDKVNYTIVEIGNKAFYDYSMTAVSMPNTVKRIGNSAFGSCSGLTSITIPNSVIEIGDAAFSNCTGLTEITIPVYVLSMKENAFRGCKSLTAFNVHSDNLNYSARNGVLFNKERTTLIQYPAAKSSPEYGIPKTVQTINSFAFDGCSNLQYISIPTSVTEIGEDAFRNCTGLSDFSIPNSVTKIGYYAFYGCSGLQEIEIPNTISSIASYTFYGCSGLTSVTIPNGVTSIGADAFEGCTGLTSITIPASVTSFGDRAFGFCSGLQSVVCEAETPPTVSTKYGLFYKVDTSFPLYVPAKSIADYRNADPWSNFENILPIAGTEPCITASGYCGAEGDGTNLAWELSCDGVLTISGIGAMADYFQDAPWYSYYKSINTVILPDDLTNIGDGAFYNCSSLTSITIPNSVSSIDNAAFYNCTGLTSVTLSNGLNSIGDGAFSGCSNLTSVSIPNSVTRIGNGAFMICTKLSSVTISYNVTSIGESAFNGCSSLTSIIIPNSVKFIGYSAFSGCTGLTSITCLAQTPPTIESSTFSNVDKSIPLYVPTGSITDYRNANPWSEFTNILPIGGTEPCIFASGYCGAEGDGTNLAWELSCDSTLTISGTGAMVNCIWGEEGPWDDYFSFIKNVIISEGVTNIGVYLFYSNYKLQSVTIPNSVTSIGYRTFDGCSGLTSIICEATNPPTLGGDAFSGVNKSIPLYVPAGSVSAYQKANGWSEFTNILPIGEPEPCVTASGYCGGEGDGTNLAWELSCDGVLTISGSGEMADDKTGPWYSYRESIKTVLLPNGLTNIGDGAFYYCSEITSITIPNSVTSIGYSAFYGCTGLTSFSIPASVTSVGGDAFNECTNLPVINNIRYADTYLVIAVDKSLSTYTIKEGTKWIGNYAFQSCSHLESITIPETVISIGNAAFEYCENLAFATIPNSVTSIGYSAFEDCSSLMSLTIPSSVTSIGYSAFERCSGLTSIKVEKENTVYDSRNDCNAIIETATNTLITGCQNTIIPNTVTSIESNAFRNCIGLTSITIPNSVTIIESFTFSDCSSLASVTIPNNVTDIRFAAFSNCSSLTSIIIPNSVTSIGGSAFSGCTGLTSIICMAQTPPTIDGFTFSIVDKSIPLYVPAGSLEDYHNASYWSEFTNILPIGEPEPCVTASGYCGGEGDGTNLAWELSCDGVLTISGSGEMANYKERGPWYSYRESFHTVILPNGLTSIGEYAFYNCTNITSITIPNSVTNIKYGAFSLCSGLTSITIPNSVTSIESEAFSYCSGITSVAFPTSVTSIGGFVFYGCTNLPVIDNIRYADTYLVETVNKNLFTCTIKEGTKWIGHYAFKQCDNLNSITIPETVISIENGAFFYCKNLASVTIPNSVTNIGHTAFSDCSRLSSITIPKNVTNIGNSAFYACTGLKSITCLAQTPPSIYPNTFYDVNKSIPLYVPAGSVEDYHNASYWSDFTNILPISEPVDETPHHIDLNLQEAPATIDGWTVNNMSLTSEKSPYIYSIEKDVTGEAYVTVHPDIVFQTMTTSGSERAVYIYPNNCIQFGEKNGVVVIKNTVAGERIRLYAAAKSKEAASLADPAGEYPKNAVTMATDLTLPGVDKGAEDADENGYRWRTIEYISLGGDVEIKEFATGYRIRRVEAVADNQPLKVSEAFALGSKLSVGASTATDVHVRGYVRNPDALNLTHMTQSFYMSDEASYESAPVFHAYNCIPTLGGQNMPVLDWDYVDVSGRLFRSKETNTNEDHIIEIQNGPTTILEPIGARSVPEIAFIDADRAIQIAKTMGNKETSKETYYVIGFVSYVNTYSGGIQSFWMSSDSTSHASNSSAFYVNSGIPDYEVKTGDVVIVRTKIYNQENHAFSESYVSVVHPEVVFINGEITYKEYGDGRWWISGGNEKLNVQFCVYSENSESPVGAYLNSDFHLSYGGVYAGAAETPITTFTYASAQVSQSDGLLTVQAAFQGKDERIYFVNLHHGSQAEPTYQVGFGIIPPDEMPANGIVVSGTFNNWQGTPLYYIEGLKIYGTAIEKVKADDEFLFHEAGNPDNYIVYYDEKEHVWLPVPKQTVSAWWQEGTGFGMSGKFVYMDFGGSNYAWKASLPDDPQIPTTKDFSGYDTKNNVILCVRFSGDAKVCNNIYFEGSFLNWELETKYRFYPLSGFEGWYVASVPYSSGTVISGKPVQMNANGSLSWDYQAGDKNAWTHMGGLQAEITDGDKDECEVTYPSAGVYIYDISYWKAHANPCYEQVYTVGVAVTPPVGTPEAGIELYGSFSEKAVPMEKSGDYWYAIIQTTASQTFGFREKNNPSNPIMKYFPDKGEWGTVSGMRFRDYWQDGAAYGYEGMYVMMDLSGNGYKWQDYVEPEPEPQPQCYFDIDMYDAYGDGWTGAEIVVVEGEKTTRYTLEDGVNERVQVPYYGEPVSFYWSAGSYDDEVSFSILASDGEGLFRLEEGTSLEDKQLLYTMEVSPCATGDNPFIPQNLRSTLTENGGLFIQWDEVSGAASYKVSVIRVDGYAIAVNKPVTDAYAYFSNLKVGGSFTITVMSCDEYGEQLGESSIMQVIDRPAVDGVTVHAYVPYGCTVNTKSGLWLAWREPGSKKWENSHIVSMKREDDYHYSVTFNPGIAAYDYLILNSSKFNTSSSSFQYSYHWSALTATEHCCILGNVESNNRFELYESADCSMENYNDYRVSDLHAKSVSNWQVMFEWWPTKKVSSLYELNIYSSDNVLLKTIAVENSTSYIWNVEEAYTNQDLKWSLRPMKPYELAETYGNTLYLKQSGEQEIIPDDIELNDDPNNPSVHIEWEYPGLNASQYRVEVEWNGIVIYTSTTGYTYYNYEPIINGVFEVYVQPLDENGNPVGYRVYVGRFVLRNIPGPIYNTHSSADEHHLSFSWSKRSYVSGVKATLYQWDGDQNYSYITETELTKNTYEYDAPEDGAYVLRLQPIVEYNGQPFVLPFYSSIIAKAFTTQTYPVQLTSGEGGSIRPEDISGEYPEGYVLTAIAEPEEGYYFAGWSDGKTNATRHIYVDQAINLHASFQPLCRVTLSAKHGSVSLNGGYDKRIGNMYYVRPGKEVTLKAYPDYEYKFTQWSDGEQTIQRFVTITSDTAFTAMFEEAPIPWYNVSIYSTQPQWGSVSDYDASYPEGTRLYLRATPKEGYAFKKWSDGVTVNPRTITVTSDVYMTVDFEVKQVNLTVAAGTGGSVNSDVNGRYTYGDYVIVHATPDNGYVFTSWSDGSALADRQLRLRRDLHLTAYFAKVEQPDPLHPVMYTLSVKSAKGGKVNTEVNGTYEKGTQVMVAAMADNEWKFDRWSDGDRHAIRLLTMKKDYSLTAYFVSTKKYKVTVTAGANGTVRPAVRDAEYTGGSVLRVRAFPNAGYKLSSWSDGNTETIRDVVIYQDTVITASFTVKPKYNVSVVAGEGGTVTPLLNNIPCEEGSTIHLEAKPNEGYRFKEWSDGNKKAVRDVVIKQDTSLTAYFTKIPVYKVTVKAGPNGVVIPPLNMAEYYEGATVHIEASPNSGYKFKEWSDGNTDAVRDIVITSDTTLIARFYAFITYTLLVEIEPKEAGYVLFDGEKINNSQTVVEQGTEVELAAEANEGYRFEYFENGHELLYSTLYIVQVNDDMTVKAVFKKETDGIELINMEPTAETRKMIIDNHLYILRDGHMYDAMGKKVK